MRTIAANWSLPHVGAGESRNWLSNLGARLRRVGSAWAARCQPTREGQESRHAFVQADVAAFISAFMRIG
jgi:hypothetical protein